MIRHWLTKLTVLSGLTVCLVAWSALAPHPVRAQGAAGEVLEIGVFPYLSTRTLLATYQPLQRFLEQRLGRPVVIVTAPDMRTFVERTLTGAYPFAITAPHFARLAQKESGYRPLLRAQRDLAGVIVVAESAPLLTLQDLRGKTLATPDRLALVTRLTLALLEEQGLKPGADVFVEPMPSHNSALLAVRTGVVAAAAVSNTVLVQLPPEQKQGVRVLARTNAVPHVMIVARRDVTPGEAEHFVQLMQTFVQQTAEGRRFLEGLGYEGLRAPTEAELRSLDPYIQDLRAMLTAPR